MVVIKSEVATLREAVHALAQASELMPQIYVLQESKYHDLESQRFSDLVKEALSKTD